MFFAGCRCHGFLSDPAVSYNSFQVEDEGACLEMAAWNVNFEQNPTLTPFIDVREYSRAAEGRANKSRSLQDPVFKRNAK